MRTIHLKTKWTDEEVEMHIGQFQNGQIAIHFTSLGNAPDSFLGESIARATVALDEVIPEGHVAVKDWSENEGMLRSLIENGVVGESVSTIAAGFCVAHICPLLVQENVDGTE